MVAVAETVPQSDLTGLVSGAHHGDVVLDSASALAAFRASLLTRPRRVKGRIVLDPDFATPEDRGLERRLNELYADCGCTLGAAAALVAAITCTARVLTADSPVGTAAGARSLAVVGAAAVAGKAVGLLYSRAALLRLTTTIAPRERQ